MPAKKKNPPSPYLIPEQFQTIEIAALRPYENNPRLNDQAVPAVAKSITDFGFLVPVVVDAENCIAAGHTRVKAATELGGTHVPYIRAEHLTDAQIKAFRLADNRTGDYADWDYEALSGELEVLQGLGDDVLGMAGFPEYEIQNYLSATFNPGQEQDDDTSTGGGGGHVVKLTDDQWALIEQAVALVKQQADDSVSDGRAIELICADYLAGVHEND